MTDQATTAELMARLVLSRDEVATLLNVEPATVANLHRLGRLRAAKIGRELRWLPSAVQAYVDGLKTK